MKAKEIKILSVVLILTAMLPIINHQTKEIIIFSHLSEAINQHIIYQTVTFLMALAFLFFLRKMKKHIFLAFFKQGDLSAPVIPAPMMGIRPKPHENWLHFGRNFLVIISLVTAIAIYFQHIKGNPYHYESIIKILPFAMIFSVTNAFVEEVITRLGIIVTLKGLLPDNNIAYISAILFGVAHYWGSPGGLIGVLLATFLGWLLCKSVLETKGLFWAWLIHCVQDIIIFSTLLNH